MSYADYLRTRELNKAVIFDRRERLGEASNYIQRTKLGASQIQGSTEHVINNQNNPFVPIPSTKKKPAKYGGSGAGGRVQDASLFTLTRGARAVREDYFSSTKTVQRVLVPCADRATPAPSLVVRAGGNFDGNRGGDFNGTDFGGLNTGYQVPCPLFQPLGNTQLVVRNPALDRLGVQSREAWNGALGTHYGSQNPLSPNCTTTLTTANHEVKLIRHGNLNSRPLKADFRTAVMGPQVSANGAYGRPGKVGGLVARKRYIESHHGNPNVDHPLKLSYAEVTFNKPETYPIPRLA
jgi:hypothetical protein